MKHRNRFLFTLPGIGMLAFSAFGSIDDRGMPETRAAGLAGADSAVVEGSAATIANPAALGFMMRSNANDRVDNGLLGEQHFGWNTIDAGLAATLTGDLGDYLQILAGIDFSDFEISNISDPKNIERLLSVAGALGSVSDSDTIIVNANLASTMQIGHFGTGFRMYGQVGGWINDLDLVNLGLQMAVSELVSALDDAIINDGFDPADYEFQTLDMDNVQRLRDALGADYVDDDGIAYIDSKLTDLVDKGDLDGDQVNRIADTLVGIIENTGLGNELADNTTSITGRGFLAAEIPISYGYAFNDNFAVGVTAKAIFGRVYGTQVWAFNDDNADIVEESLDSSVDRLAFGLDLAAMYRLPKWQFALTGYNLNKPTFEGYTQEVAINGSTQTIKVPSVKLDPQITFGAAWMPAKRLLFATDIELLETGTLLNGYDVQRISFGSELDLSFLLLRLGTYKNIAEADIGWVLTAGIGAQLWAFSVDLAAAVSINDTVRYDGIDYPRTARLHAGISLDF